LRHGSAGGQGWASSSATKTCGDLGGAMNWEQWYRLRHAARTSLVLWPTLSLVAALLCAPAVRWLDRETGWELFHFSPEGARAVLQALAGSLLTFIVFVLSAMLIVVQLASGQLTPRVIAIVFAKPQMKVVLGMLTFTFVYTLSALGRINGRVPDLHVSVAILLNLACIGGFFFFVQKLSEGLRPTSVMRDVAERGQRVIEAVYPVAYVPGRAEETVRGLLPRAPVEVVESTLSSGMIMAISMADVVHLAREADAVLELVPQVGPFLQTRCEGASRSGPSERWSRTPGLRSASWSMSPTKPSPRESMTRPQQCSRWIRSTTCCSASVGINWTTARPTIRTAPFGSSTARPAGPTT
jgi:uncharacterized membrane protein